MSQHFLTLLSLTYSVIISWHTCSARPSTRYRFPFTIAPSMLTSITVFFLTMKSLTILETKPVISVVPMTTKQSA